MFSVYPRYEVIAVEKAFLKDKSFFCPENKAELFMLPQRIPKKAKRKKKREKCKEGSGGKLSLSFSV